MARTTTVRTAPTYANASTTLANGITLYGNANGTITVASANGMATTTVATCAQLQAALTATMVG